MYTGNLWLVIPKEERAAYSAAIGQAGVTIVTILEAPEKGLVKQRKFFREKMPLGTQIVFMDDDIESVKIKTPDGLKHCSNIEFMAQYVFEKMADTCLLAGVYPVINRDWMSNSITRSNTNIVGAMYFCINDVRLEEPIGDIDGVEDLARCIKEQNSRPTLRFNFIGIQTRYFKNPGGIQDNREAKRETQIDSIIAAYPATVKKIIKRNGMIDIKFLQKPEIWQSNVGLE